MKKQFFGFLVFLFVACISNATFSQTVLTVGSATGRVDKSLTLLDLQGLDQTEITTSNEFVDGERVFRGPLVRDILVLCKANGVQQVLMTAANDYQVEIDVSEFFDYDVILALSMDGELLSKREKGPIWIIYPMSDHVELRDPVFNSRLVWQLVNMEFR